ncbi:hypothetical protein AcV5_005453 [Taiwanofungus camphoratus]|nr:hypothetical protein AcV5_005453 [Antrodia cinnamomea]
MSSGVESQTAQTNRQPMMNSVSEVRHDVPLYPFIHNDAVVSCNATKSQWSEKHRMPAPVLAECVGGPFRVFGTKAFPGLRASTDLTKHISRFGACLNIREHQRTPRRRAPMRTEPHPHPHPHPPALKPRLRPKPLAPAGRRRSAGPASDRGGGGDGDEDGDRYGYGDRYGGESSAEDGWAFGA